MVTTTKKKEPFKIKPFGLQPDVIICIDNEDLLRYRYLVNQVKPDEVQWYAKVERVMVPADRRSQHVHRPFHAYYITDMFIPEQEVSGGSVDTDVRKDPMKMYRLMQEMEARHPDPDADLGFDVDAVNEDMKAMHAWCHSHPFTSNPYPSGQDDKMFEDWITDNQIAQGITTPMVALIFGSGEKIHGRLYDPLVPGVMYDDVDVHVDYNEDFDTDYMDEAVASKISKKTYATSGSYVRCADGTFRTADKKKEFDRKLLETADALAAADPEIKAGKFFEKHFNGDWTEFLKLFNSKYNNDVEVMDVWAYMGKWLNTDLERTMFSLALTDSPSGLRTVAQGDQDDLFLLNNEDALIVLVNHFASDTLCNIQLRGALTFAKRYVKQDNEAGRLRAVGSLENALSKIQHQDTVWDAIEEEAAAAQNSGTEGYGFLDEDDFWDDGTVGKSL